MTMPVPDQLLPAITTAPAGDAGGTARPGQPAWALALAERS
jgi:hypothetical protein